MAEPGKQQRKTRQTQSGPKRAAAKPKPKAKQAPKPRAPRRGGRKRKPPKLKVDEALQLIRMDVVAEGDLPVREQMVAIGRKLYGGWLKGASFRMLAEEHGLSEAHVERVVNEYRKAKLQVVPGPASALLMVHGHISRLEQMVSDFGALAASEAAQKQPQVVLAAKKEQRETMRQLLDVWQEMGWLPRQLGTLNTTMDAIAMVDAILDVLDKHSIGEDVQRELVEAVEMRAVRQGGRIAPSLEDVVVPSEEAVA